MDSSYDAHFFANQVSGSLASAQVVVPLILGITNVNRVVDVGCGLGAWLRVFKEHGVEVTTGIDGDWVDQSKMLIDPECFIRADLTRTLSLDERFDLAMSLEVAEHLPRRCASTFVSSLTRLAPFVLFSAAAPGQGGINHVNEQWPDWWEQLFRDRGFVRLDPIRPQIWRDDRVAWWYRQNIFLFVTHDLLRSNRHLADLADDEAKRTLELVHRGLLKRNLGVRASLRRIALLRSAVSILRTKSLRQARRA